MNAAEREQTDWHQATGYIKLSNVYRTYIVNGLFFIWNWQNDIIFADWSIYECFWNRDCHRIRAEEVCGHQLNEKWRQYLDIIFKWIFFLLNQNNESMCSVFAISIFIWAILLGSLCYISLIRIHFIWYPFIAFKYCSTFINLVETELLAQAKPIDYNSFIGVTKQGVF